MTQQFVIWPGWPPCIKCNGLFLDFQCQKGQQLKSNQPTSDNLQGTEKTPNRYRPFCQSQRGILMKEKPHVQT